MKKILLFLILIFCLGACNKANVNDVPVSEIISTIEKQYPIKNFVKEDLTNQEFAERYGISPNDIEEGIVYYADNREIADKIILIKAKGKENIEGLERAIAAEIVGMVDSWKDNEVESKKVEKHIFRTKDLYIILCISDNAENIISIFDSMLSTE